MLGAWGGSSLLTDRRMECDEVDRLMHFLSGMVGRSAGSWILDLPGWMWCVPASHVGRRKACPGRVFVPAVCGAC